MNSIRDKLVLQIIVGIALLLIAGSSLLFVNIQKLLVGSYDQSMIAKANVLATLVVREGRKLEVDFAGEYMPEFEVADNPEYFQFRFQNAGVIERSDMLGDMDLPFMENASMSPFLTNLRLPDGRKGRLVQIACPPRLEDREGVIDDDKDWSLLPGNGGPESAVVILSVARSREDLDSMIRFIFWAVAVLNGVVIAMVWLFVTRAIRMGFKPIDDLNDQIHELSSTGLDARIRLPSAPEELQTILAEINSLLSRVHVAFLREQRFSDDVAHELRTPVAELRSACAIALKWPDDPEIRMKMYEDVQDVAKNMEKIVANLLELARAESGKLELRNEAVQIMGMVNKSWNSFEPEAKARSLRFENEVEHDLVLNTDSDKLEVIIQNLISNTVAHSVAGSKIHCKSEHSGNVISIIIKNTCEDLEPQDLEHMHDRFWQKDPARSSSNHSGLGLSIVQSLCAVLDIDYETVMEDRSVFTSTLNFASYDDSKSDA